MYYLDADKKKEFFEAHGANDKDTGNSEAQIENKNKEHCQN